MQEELWRRREELSPGDSMRCARQITEDNPKGWISRREHEGMMLVEFFNSCYTMEIWLEVVEPELRKQEEARMKRLGRVKPIGLRRPGFDGSW